MKTQNINKVYIGQDELIVHKEPDLILEVEGTDPFPIWYNNEIYTNQFNTSQNRLGKRLDLQPNSGGICEVYFPEEVTSLFAWMDPNCCIDYTKDPVAVSIYEGGYNNPYFSRVKKVFGMNKFMETHNIDISEFITVQKNCTYAGDFENFNMSHTRSIETIPAPIIYWVSSSKPMGKCDLRKWKPYNTDTIGLKYTSFSEIDISSWDANRIKAKYITFTNNRYLEKIKVYPNFSTASIGVIRDIVSDCPKLREVPFVIDCSSILPFVTNEQGQHTYNNSSMWSIFMNDTSLKSITLANTGIENCNHWWMTFSNCPELEEVKGIDLKYATIVNLFSNSSKLKKLIIKNIGYTDWKQWVPSNESLYGQKNTIRLTGVPNWGADSEENRKTLVDSLLTYSFDRASAGRTIHNILLNTSTLNRLTDSEKAAITAKGYNLIGK